MIIETSPDFWLGFAFLFVVGSGFFPPIYKAIQKSFSLQRKKVEMDIENAEKIYQKAKKTYHEIVKESNKKNIPDDFEQKNFKDELDEKIKTQIQLREQDFKIRQKMTENEIKNQLKKNLLNQMEKEFLASSKRHHTLDIRHFIQVLQKNKEIFISEKKI